MSVVFEISRNSIFHISIVAGRGNCVTFLWHSLETPKLTTLPNHLVDTKNRNAAACRCSPASAIMHATRGLRNNLPLPLHIIPHHVPIQILPRGEKDAAFGAFGEAVGEADVFFGLRP